MTESLIGNALFAIGLGATALILWKVRGDEKAGLRKLLLTLSVGCIFIGLTLPMSL